MWVFLLLLWFTYNNLYLIVLFIILLLLLLILLKQDVRDVVAIDVVDIDGNVVDVNDI